MGREAKAWISYGEAAGEGRVLLESDELILRGQVKARIPRAALTHARVDGSDLVLDAPGGTVRASLGEVEAGRWLTALSKPAPTLRDKLGVKAGTRLWTWATEREPTLASALAGAVTTAPVEADLMIAVVEGADDLDAVLTQADAASAPLWLVYRKGVQGFGDAAIRERMRALGLVDNKACAVSAAFTATRYAPRKA